MHICLCCSQSYSQHHYPRAYGYPIHKQGSHAVMICIQGAIHPSFTVRCKVRSLSLAGTPRQSLVSHRPLCQQNMKRCLLWDSWEEFPQVTFFLRRRKKERDARQKYYLCSFGGWLSVHHPWACLSHLRTEWREKNS